MHEKNQTNIFKRIGVRPLLVTGGLLGLLGAVLFGNAPSAEEPRLVPAALHDVAAASGPQTAVLAGGCFWGVQGVFQHVDGVISATSGYAGGTADTANYEATETGRTGHAEAVQIVFDPQKISYGTLLQIYFSIAHDPTQVDRQGPDSGTQYRSAVFPQTGEQAQIAADYIAQLDSAKIFTSKIATRIEADKPFYEAEAYHQDFMANNPSYPYVVYNEVPKIENLKAIFPQYYRADPVLLAEGPG